MRRISDADVIGTERLLARFIFLETYRLMTENAPVFAPASTVDVDAATPWTLFFDDADKAHAHGPGTYPLHESDMILLKERAEAAGVEVAAAYVRVADGVHSLHIVLSDSGGEYIFCAGHMGTKG